jgi:hypothetical protein
LSTTSSGMSKGITGSPLGARISSRVVSSRLRPMVLGSTRGVQSRQFDPRFPLRYDTWLERTPMPIPPPCVIWKVEIIHRYICVELIVFANVARPNGGFESVECKLIGPSVHRCVVVSERREFFIVIGVGKLRILQSARSMSLRDLMDGHVSLHNISSACPFSKSDGVSSASQNHSKRFGRQDHSYSGCAR